LDAPQEMGKKRITANKLANMESANRFIQGLNKLLCIGLAVAFGLLIAATAAPQKKELEKLEAKLCAMQNREDETLARKEHKEIELQALREDPSYLEIQARDRLNYYREGERVLRFGGNR
jgi:cell division protein FtsB